MYQVRKVNENIANSAPAPVQEEFCWRVPGDFEGKEKTGYSVNGM